MAEYNFKKDVIVGEKGESTVIHDLISLGGEFVSDNKDFKFDVIMKFIDENIKYEIKTDVFCKPDNDTNNIFVEYECRNKPSGIKVTEAKWFVTYFKHLHEIWYIQTSVLKELIEKNEFRKTEFSGDSGSNTKGLLIPRYQHKKHFIVRKINRNI